MPRRTQSELNPTELQVLRYLAEHPASTYPEVAEALGLTLGQAQTAYYTLEQLEFISGSGIQEG